MQAVTQIRFDGKRALVTGAGKGIGRDVCLLLHQCGAEIVAISRSKEDLESLSKEIPCQTIAVDLENVEEVKKAVESIGQIDLLVNNAGIASLAPFLETKLEDYERVMNVNVRQVVVVSQIVAKGMVERKKGGTIVNVSSQASSVAIAEHTSYCTSKGALDQLTRMMALELGPHNVRVNAVNPTVTLTPMGEFAWSEKSKAEPMLAKIPLGRFAKPREVSNVIAFLLSDLSSMSRHPLVITLDDSAIDGICVHEDRRLRRLNARFVLVNKRRGVRQIFAQLGTGRLHSGGKSFATPHDQRRHARDTTEPPDL
ncbi:Diacetyl/L-xylulose reductase [Planoprotostelium fungivorum]|uniref:Diacetyl/L-xylulose reductase n=1 Tax=Planoprotostelium fungivorum TaxID=1890364 RepID=A0A2P6NZR0_9EUKA|nr:Diacetyl/L-xylulose reductase [Planoprotostelium fungivorum]